MPVTASAPGKLVVLGEYAVLAGAEALVMAVDRRCYVRLQARGGECSQVEIRMPAPATVEFAAADPCGITLFDAVRFSLTGPAAARPLAARVDSSAFFTQSGQKLGLGSSAAVLVALAGAFQAFENKGKSRLTLSELIDLHRQQQGGAGSGVDVAAALGGGLQTFRLAAANLPEVGSVQVPNSVGFAGIFAGKSAATSDFVERFHDWRRTEPAGSAALLADLAAVSAAGCGAVRAGDSDGFLAAVAEYGVLLDTLGGALCCDVLTPEHRRIAALAERFAVTYKTSGAGGGDLGIAFSRDADALAALRKATAAEGFLWVNLDVDPQGLLVEELTE